MFLMSSVKMIYLILVFLVRGLWETEAMSVTGMLGKDVTIKCSHSNAFSNVKYFCKGVCEDEDVLISSIENKKASNEKYSIKDEGNTFYVTISHLTEEDSGTHWCAIERFALDTYNKVVITVKKGHTNPDLPDSNASSNKKLLYIGVGLGVAVLTLVMAFLIFFRHRNRNIHASSGKDHDTVYTTHTNQKQDGRHVTNSSSTANEDQETDSRTNSIFSSSTAQRQDTRRDHSDNIYCNVTASPESETQPHGLFYSTVSFNIHPDCSTVNTGQQMNQQSIAMSELSADHLHC